MKIRATRTMIVEYEPNLEHYPGAKTAEDVIIMDKIAVDRDAELFFDDCISDNVEFEVLEP